jgi:hypothetical protein
MKEFYEILLLVIPGILNLGNRAGIIKLAKLKKQ